MNARERAQQRADVEYTNRRVRESQITPADPRELLCIPKAELVRLGTFPTCWARLHPDRHVWMRLDEAGVAFCPLCKELASGPRAPCGDAVRDRA